MQIFRVFFFIFLKIVKNHSFSCKIKYNRVYLTLNFILFKV